MAPVMLTTQDLGGTGRTKYFGCDKFYSWVPKSLTLKNRLQSQIVSDNVRDAVDVDLSAAVYV